MSFRLDGYLLTWEAENAIGQALGSNSSVNPMQEAATRIFGQDWFDARNRQSEKYPGLSLVIEQDGSTSYILNTVLSRWVFRSLLGTNFLPLYFCSPTGHIVRTLTPAGIITPFERNEFWIRFKPAEASLDDFIEAFIGIETERNLLVNDLGIVKPPRRRLWPWRINQKLRLKLGANWAEEVKPFVGWSACVPLSDKLFDPIEMISISLRASGYAKKVGNQFELEADSTPAQAAAKSSGRPSLQPEILAHYRERYPDGRKGRSLSEIARVLGYDRKTTRKALEAGGLLSEDDSN